MEQAKRELLIYEEAVQCFASLFNMGMAVRHNTFGEGSVISMNDNAHGRRTVEVLFPKIKQTKQLDTVLPLLSGNLHIGSVSTDELKEKELLYGDCLRRGETSIVNAKEHAEKEFMLYREYLD